MGLKNRKRGLFPLVLFLFMLSVFTVCSKEEDDHIIESNGIYVENIKPYLVDEYVKTCMTIDSLMDEDCFLVGFITDLHYSAKGSKYHEKKLRTGVFNALDALRELTFRYEFSQVILGGDYVQTWPSASDNIDIQQGIDCVTDALNAAREFNAPFFLLRGNHEVSYSGKPNDLGMTAEKFYRYSSSQINNPNLKLDSPNNWAYYDDLKNKVRYIFLDVVSASGCPQNQFDWLQNTAGSIPDSFSVMVSSHYPLVNMGEREGNVKYNSVIQRMRKEGHPIIACLGGHIHADWHNVVDSVLHVTTLQAGLWTPKPSEDGITYEHERDSYKESAFDILVINKKQHKINLVRFGLGKDRCYKY